MLFVHSKVVKAKGPERAKSMERYRKFRKGGIVQALYAIPAWAYFFWMNFIFLGGGGISFFEGNYSNICEA